MQVSEFFFGILVFQPNTGQIHSEVLVLVLTGGHGQGGGQESRTRTRNGELAVKAAAELRTRRVQQ